jgi:hypothetical protein
MSDKKQEEQKKKQTITPEQVKKACDAMGGAANAVDNFYDNVRFTLGPVGKAVGAGIVLTLVVALISNPVLVWILALMIAAGAAPLIRSKIIELKESGEKAKEEEKKLEVEEKEEKK